MKKLFRILILFLIIFSLCSCSSANQDIDDQGITQTKNQNESEKATSLNLQIDGTELKVNWEDNETVAALLDICKKQELTIQMSKYGDFEQVGPIGYDLPSHNSQMTTNPGDIVLYNQNQLVIFFGSNSWDYTKLGHIDKTQEELDNLLDKENITVILKEN